MKSFRSIAVPPSMEELPRTLRLVQQAIEQAAARDVPYVELEVLHASPDKTFPGMVVYADGTDWDPGSGEGVYVRNAANAAWRYLG